MSLDEQWEDEAPIGDRFDGLEVPEWIDQTISPSEVAAIVQGGCASGAYMPAVLYRDAVETMSEHGDEVLRFVEDRFGELPEPPDGANWSGLAVHYLSCAVELWAQHADQLILQAMREREEEDEDDDEEA